MTHITQSPVRAGFSKEPIVRAAASTHLTECEWLTPDAKRLSIECSLEWELWCRANKFGHPVLDSNCSVAFRLTLNEERDQSGSSIPDDVPRMIAGIVEASEDEVKNIFRDLAKAGRIVERIVDDNDYSPFGYNSGVDIPETKVSRLLFKSCLGK